MMGSDMRGQSILSLLSLCCILSRNSFEAFQSSVLTDPFHSNRRSCIGSIGRMHLETNSKFMSQPLLSILSMQTSDIDHEEEMREIIKEPTILKEDPFLQYPKRVISASISSPLPFSSTLAFDAFSDLPRQPTWAPWLKKVVYLDEESNFEQSTSSSQLQDGLPLRETEWTLRLKGVNFSWRAISTELKRPHLIQWESTSGIRNRGTVTFNDVTKDTCEMNITMSFVMPRVLVKVFQKSGFVKKFFTERMLGGMLERFRYVVMKEDLGIETKDTIIEYVSKEIEEA